MKRREFLAIGPALPAAMSATVTITHKGHEPIDLEMSVLKCQPGDVLVFRTDAIISADQAARIQAAMAHVCPGVKSIVLSDGMKLDGVLRS